MVRRRQQLVSTPLPLHSNPLYPVENPLIPFLSPPPRYGWAMCRYLPFNDLRFCHAEELEVLRNEFMNFKGSRLSEAQPVGFAIEVTLRYPEEMKNSFREYPVVRFIQCAFFRVPPPSQPLTRTKTSFFLFCSEFSHFSQMHLTSYFIVFSIRQESDIFSRYIIHSMQHIEKISI